MVFISYTRCCSLGQLSCDDDESIDRIKEVIQAENTNRGYEHSLRSVFCIVRKDEEILRENLKRLKFELITTIPRLHCYDDECLGDLEMWILK